MPVITLSSGLKGDQGAAGKTGDKGDKGQDGKSGVKYVRWGKTTCPRDADIVYKGMRIEQVFPFIFSKFYFFQWKIPDGFSWEIFHLEHGIFQITW